MLTVMISFLLFLAAFAGIGVYSATHKQDTPEDYLVASRNVKPWMMALSAVATNNSGFMFVGLIGETYAIGVSAAWIMVGWVFGDYLAWIFGVPRRLRERSAATGTVTVPSFLGHGMRGGRMVTALAGLITLTFLGVYAAAQLNAGSKALHTLFGWHYNVGAILGAALVGLYCFSGGIRASIWTDVAQSIVMMAAMFLLAFSGISAAGGLSGLWERLAAIDPNLIRFIPENLPLGFGLFLLGWVGAGLGLVGQPHIMVRAMAIDSAAHIDRARRIYITWYAAFSAAAIGVGLAARALIPATESFDPELAMPTLAAQLLPGVLIGVVLAGLFAATMSTADSQVLSCSAAITQDIAPRLGKRLWMVKAATILVTLIALGFALIGESVFTLVVLAWSMLASGLGPLMVLRTFDRPVNAPQALMMMSAGIAAVVLWRYGFDLSGAMYDVTPGMLAGFAVYFSTGWLQRGMTAIQQSGWRGRGARADDDAAAQDRQARKQQRAG